MFSQQETPASPARPDSHSDNSSQSSHNSKTIDSQPTSPSHSTDAEEDLKNLALTVRDPCSPEGGEDKMTNTNADIETETETEQEPFKGPEPITANSAEIQEFSRLAAELSLFASCIASSPSPPSPNSPPSPTSSSSSSPPSNSNPSTADLESNIDAEKTPTQASTTSTSQAASQAASQANALIEQRKAELTHDLMELIEEEDGPNRELILGIDRLMRDWTSLHERLERWRGEKKGEKVREMYKRDF